MNTESRDTPMPWDTERALDEDAPEFSTTYVAAGDAEYDVHVVRYFSPTAIQEVETRGGYPSETG